MSDQILHRLAKLDSCAVSDAKDSLALPPAVSDVPRLSGEGVLVGQVKTVRLVAGVPDASQPKVHLGARAIVQSTDQTVIVVSHPGIDAGGWGGVLSTAGGVVFFGEDSGAFAAVDAKTGKDLWHIQTNASTELGDGHSWRASPMTFMAGGKQYVAVAAGPNILCFGLP